jgi:hypothetical protein
MPPHDLHLDAADAIELGELLAFLDDCLDGNDSTLLAASLHRFVSTTATTSASCAPTWRASPSCSAPTTAPNSSAPTSHEPHREPTPPGARTGDDRWGQIT